VPWIAIAAIEGLKATSKQVNILTGSHRDCTDITKFKTAIVEKTPGIFDSREILGMAIRRWDSHNGHWRSHVLFSILSEIMKQETFPPVDASDIPTHSVQIGHPTKYDLILRDWSVFLDHLRKLELFNAPSLKHIVNGTMLQKALGIKTGPWMKPALDIVMAWQLRHPHETDGNGAIEEVCKRREELHISK
jgi:hypothetical protein